METSLDTVKPLTTEQFDRCREAALARTLKRIGERPERVHYQRKLGPVWTVLDLIALLVFLAALMLSSVHIIAHMGTLASESYDQLQQTDAGTHLGKDFYSAVHQWSMIALAEGSMILFMVLFTLTRKNWRRGVFLTLALVAMAFVIIANWQSEIGVLEAIMPAIFTIGLGLNLERLIVQTLRRREEVNERYLAALTIYEQARLDPTQHPDYLPILRQEIWQKLVSLKANEAYRDASPAFKQAAVEREIQREQWAYGNRHSMPISVNAPKEDTQPESRPFGTTAHELAENASMPMSGRANGHGGASTTEN